MSYYYNTSNITGANNIYELFNGLNQLSGMWLGNIIWITIFFIAMISFKQFTEFEESLAGASFVSMAIALLLFQINLIHNKLLLLSFILVALSLVLLYLKNR